MRKSKRTGQVVRTLWIVLGLGAAAWAPAIAHAQFGYDNRFELKGIKLPEADEAVGRHLDRVKEFISDAQWDEAVETLRRIMETDGQPVTKVAAGQFVTIRDYCQILIGQLPPEALELYRQRVDPLARRWYTEGVEQRDAGRLRRVVDQMYFSRFGDEALFALGELALEQGFYGEARFYWEQISPLLKSPEGRPLWLILRMVDVASDWKKVEAALSERKSPPTWLSYQDSDLDLAEVRARLVLVSILEGNLERASVELDLFTRLHPQSRGHMGGREVNFVEKLQGLLSAASSWPQPEPDSAWPTFAGSAKRNKAAPRAVRIAGPAWKDPITLGEPLEADVDPNGSLGFGGRRPAEDIDGLLSYHPVVSGDLLMVNSEREIKVFNLHTGQPAWAQKDGVVFASDQRTYDHTRRGRLGAPRFTMTAADGKLYAKMGNPITGRVSQLATETDVGYLVCLDLEANGLLLWKILPERGWSFEGSPLVDRANVYVGMRRSGANDSEAWVGCFDRRTGDRRWQQKICTADTPAQGVKDEITHNLLTLAEGTLYYNTNLGAVAALDAQSGRLRWVRLYQRARRGNRDLAEFAVHRYRDLTPCIYDRGMLFVAPQDSKEILALDAASGQVLWTTDLPQDTIHLLGVRNGRLIASGNRLWWIDIHDGRAVRHFPEVVKSGPRGFGRGMIAGDEIFWPTREKVFIFDCRTACQTQEPILLSALGAKSGNLLIVDGYLLIAGSETLFGYTQFVRHRKALEQRVSQNPDDPLAHYQLAQCEEAEDHWRKAADLFQRASQLSGPQQRHEGRLLSELARERLYRVLSTQASSSEQRGAWDEALSCWQDAAGAAPSVELQLAARIRCGEVLLHAGKPAETVGLYQAILTDPRYAAVQIPVEADRSVAAPCGLAASIEALITKHGRGLYEAFEAEARTGFAAARQQGDLVRLSQLVSQYPNAEIRPRMLFALAQLADKQQDSRRALRAWREVSGVYGDLPLSSLAVEVDSEAGGAETVRDYVRQRLLSEVNKSHKTPSASQSWALPIREVWARQVSDAGRLSIDGGQPAGWAMLAQRNGVQSVSLATGKDGWHLPLEEKATWTGKFRQSLLVANAQQVVCVAAQDGTIRWRWHPRDDKHDPLPLGEFQLAGQRLLVRVGTQRAVVLDAADGSMIWTTAAPPGSTIEAVCAAGDFIVVQQGSLDETLSAASDRPAVETLIYDLRSTGRDSAVKPRRLVRRVAFPRDTSPQVQSQRRASWLRPPVAWDESHLVVVTASRRVELIDLESGTVLWSRRPSQTTPSLRPDVVVAENLLLMFAGDGQLMRLDPWLGSDLWTGPAQLGPQLPARPRELVAVDSRAVYCATAGQLVALDLGDGRMMWQTGLDDEAHEQPPRLWRVLRHGPYVASHPVEFGKQTGVRLVLVDATDGRMIFRSRTFRAPAGKANILWQADRMVVAGPNRLWSLAGPSRAKEALPSDFDVKKEFPATAAP